MVWRASNVGCLLLIFAALYFVELASFPLSIDEELAAFRDDASVWIAQGRWAAYLVETFILPQPSIPFVPVAVFGVCCAVSFLIVLDIVRGRDCILRGSDYASFAIFSAFPTWFFIVEFYSNIATVGLGFLGVSLAWYCFYCWSDSHWYRRFPIAAMLGAWAIGCYQSFLLLLIVMGLGIEFLRALNSRRALCVWTLLQVSIVVSGALMLSRLADFAFRSFRPGQNPYFDGILQIDHFLDQPIAVLWRTLNMIRGAYGLSENLYALALWAVPVCMGLGLASILIARCWSLKYRSGLAAGVLFLAAIPFVVHPLAAGYLPTRSLVAVPFVVWMLAYVALNSEELWIRNAAVVAMSIAIFQIVVIQNSYQASNYFSSHNDRATAAAIYQKASLEPGFDAKKKYAVVVFGDKPFRTIYPRPWSSTVGHSFFEWDGGNSWRIARYMNLLGYSSISGPSSIAQAEYAQRLLEMPIWPEKGSVRLEDGVILVRLGARPNRLFRDILDKQGVVVP